MTRTSVQPLPWRACALTQQGCRAHYCRMMRLAALALALLAVATVPVQAADVQGASRGLAAARPGAHPGTQHLFKPQPVNHHGFNHHPISHYPFNRRPYIPYGGFPVYASPVWYVPYASYVPAPVYESPVVYGPPWGSTTLFAREPSPLPTVIPYPTGRYELRGDGLTSPYQWVWIPNPPPIPPAAPPAPPIASPEGSPAPSTLSPIDPAAAHRNRLYRWVDDQAVVHFTQGWDAVPERYRAQVKLAGAP